MNKLLFTNIHWIVLFSSIIIILSLIMIYFSIQKNDNRKKILDSTDKISNRLNSLEKNLIGLNNNILNTGKHSITNITNSTNYLKTLIEKSATGELQEEIIANRLLQEQEELNKLNMPDSDTHLEDMESEIPQVQEVQVQEVQVQEEQEEQVQGQEGQEFQFQVQEVQEEVQEEVKEEVQESSQHIPNSTVFTYNSLTNKSKSELQQLCIERNIVKSGNKDVLIERLIENGYNE